MDAIFTKEEVKKCLFNMNGSKAPGPDGMPARFFQHYWDTVGDTLCSMVLNFLNNGAFLKKFNFTLITLIPKVDRPLNMTQFKPIAICNMVTKVIAKFLVDRLKRLFPLVILETQSALVLQRLITNNILLAYEARHVIKRKKTRKEGYMSIKLDMLKAYDRVEWSFLREMLIQLGLSAKWVQTIMVYVESVTYSLLINGEHVGYVKPGRGLRQGDPLSPYLFIVCTEGLISLLNGACTNGDLQGIKLGSNLNPLTHLMFSDDTLLLGKATVGEARTIKSILSTYEM
ncbi:hypothetical protein LIER_39941 [Lithospermum erythrorhizon]|uniref:Reverse transcriptase domain-containing protein n=1 Tax=Lithospermum erythrorhizon TaxID=34254 RepID=A0AAV3QNH6_LITER